MLSTALVLSLGWTRKACRPVCSMAFWVLLYHLSSPALFAFCSRTCPRPGMSSSSIPALSSQPPIRRHLPPPGHNRIKAIKIISTFSDARNQRGRGVMVTRRIPEIPCSTVRRGSWTWMSRRLSVSSPPSYSPCICSSSLPQVQVGPSSMFFISSSMFLVLRKVGNIFIRDCTFSFKKPHDFTSFYLFPSFSLYVWSMPFSRRA